MEHQTLGQWVVHPSDLATQCIVLKIVGFYKWCNVKTYMAPLCIANQACSQEFAISTFWSCLVLQPEKKEPRSSCEQSCTPFFVASGN